MWGLGGSRSQAFPTYSSEASTSGTPTHDFDGSYHPEQTVFQPKPRADRRSRRQFFNVEFSHFERVGLAQCVRRCYSGTIPLVPPAI